MARMSYAIDANGCHIWQKARNSRYPSPLYDELYSDWERHEHGAWTGQGNSRATRTEVAWCNYTVHPHLFTTAAMCAEITAAEPEEDT